MRSPAGAEAAFEAVLSVLGGHGVTANVHALAGPLLGVVIDEQRQAAADVAAREVAVLAGIGAPVRLFPVEMLG